MANASGMRRALTAATALALLAGGGPALAAAKPAPKHAACKAPAGAIVVKPGKQVSLTPETPIGAGNGFETPVGDVYVDLGGTPLSKKATLTLQLSWTNPVSDYDLVVDGVNPLGTDNPEVAIVKAKHCKPVTVATDVFLGVPVDALTFTASAR